MNYQLYLHNHWANTPWPDQSAFHAFAVIGKSTHCRTAAVCVSIQQAESAQRFLILQPVVRRVQHTVTAQHLQRIDKHCLSTTPLKPLQTHWGHSPIKHKDTDTNTQTHTHTHTHTHAHAHIDTHCMFIYMSPILHLYLPVALPLSCCCWYPLTFPPHLAMGASVMAGNQYGDS